MKEEMIHVLNTSGSTWAGEIFRDVKAFVICSTKTMMRSDPHKSRAKAAVVEKFLVKNGLIDGVTGERLQRFTW